MVYALSFMAIIVIILLVLYFRAYIRLKNNEWFMKEIAGLLGHAEDTRPILLLEGVKEKIESLEKEAEEAVESRKKIDAVLDEIPQPILTIDSDKNVIYVNNTATCLLSKQKNEVLGKKLFELLDSYELLSTVEKAMEDEKVLESEVVFYYPNKRYYNLIVSPILRNKSKMFLIVMIDVTKERKLDEMRKEFITNVSHELRTPLTSIHGWSETLLEDGLRDKEIALNALKIIEEESGRLTRLINDLLDLEKMEEGQMKFEFEEVNLVDIVEKVYEIVNPLAHSFGVKIHKELEETRIFGDYDRLTQAILNIVDNAVKYTSQKSDDPKEVFIRTFNRDDEAIVEVEDTGPGIPEEAKAKLFQRFYRIDKARSRKLGGTGLGLSIVKLIMDKHGGRIEVAGEPGEGAIFRLIFPKNSSQGLVINEHEDV